MTMFVKNLAKHFLAPAVLVGAGALGVTFGSSLTNSDTTGMTPSPNAKSASALNALRTDLAAQLKSTAGTMKPTSTTELRCELYQQWPMMSQYKAELDAGGADARPLGAKLAREFQADGWKVVSVPARPAEFEWNLKKDGFTVEMKARAKDGVVRFEGYTPCVASDGTVTDA